MESGGLAVKSGVAAIAAAAILLAGAVAPALACRCAQQPLEIHYRNAAVVLFARVAGVAKDGPDLRLDLVPTALPYKGAIAEGTRFVTASNSAACGLAVEPEMQVLVFAEADEPGSTTLRLSTCNGSRRFGPEELALEEIFPGVPPRFLVAQLTALQGAAALADESRDAPRPRDPESRGLVGLVDIPAFAHGGVVHLRERRDAEMQGEPIESMERLEAREASYEFPAAVVFAAPAGWYRLRRRGGDFGWLRGADAGTFWRYEDLPLDRLSYLTQAWDRFVWPEPGAGIPSRIDVGARREPLEYPVQVRESRRIADSLWFRVELLDSDGCDGREQKVTHVGWVHAYGPGGAPAVWFHARGC